MDDEEQNESQGERARPAQFKPPPAGPQSSPQPLRPFQRHRILSDDQFGQVAIPEPVRRSTAAVGEAWQGRGA
jgi:hypothetical protein